MALLPPRLSRLVFEHAHRSIQSRSGFISALFKSRRYWAPPSLLSTRPSNPSQPTSALSLTAPALYPPDLPTDQTYASAPKLSIHLALLAYEASPSCILRCPPSPSSPSSPPRPSPSSLGPPSPIVLISEPTGLVVNSVRHLPNGDVSLSFPPPYLCLCLCLCRLVFLALALGDAFFFSPSSSAHPSRVEPGITARVWSRPR
jgi:hypothetical protein